MPSLRQRLRDWLELEASVPPPPALPPALPTESPIALETVKAIAELAAKEYANENDTQKSLDTKTATWLGATGAVLIFTIGTLGKIPPTATLFGFDHRGYAVAYAIVLGLAIAFLAGAQVCFVVAFRTRIYRSMNVQAWTTYESARLPPIEAYIELAGEYHRTIQENREIGQRKVHAQRRGVERCLLPALGCLILVLVLQLLATW